MGESLRDYCARCGMEELLRQWDRKRNGALDPDALSRSDRRKVWWICDKGHAWQATVKSRAEGCGCPVCAGKTVAPGENDLATVNPALAAQWHPTKNGALTARDVTAGCRRKVWWLCEKGHAWQAQPLTRIQGCGCPVCAGKTVAPGENDLAAANPALAAQWHPTLNGTLTPQAVTPQSNRRVWWLCERGHAWRSPVSMRTAHSSGCPYCAGRQVWPGFNDLLTLEPEVAAQWHPTLNGRLTAQDVTAGSRRKVWWVCSLGHVWKAAIYSRTAPQHCGCPVCAGRVRRTVPARYAASGRVDTYSGKNYM